MIQHTVVFRLKHAQGSAKEQEFLQRAKSLGKLPNVIDLKVQRQLSRKNDFTFGLTMFFASQQDYDGYNHHPDHIAFVNDVWIPEVAEFMEIDYVELSI